MHRIVTRLISHYRDFEARLAAIEEDPSVQRHGDRVRQPKQFDLAEAFRDTALMILKTYRETDEPKDRAEAARARALVLAAIRRGDAPPSVASRKSGESGPDAALMARLSDVERQVRIQNAFAMCNLLPTDTLWRRILEYQEMARGEEFPYRRYAVEREVIPAILAARGAQGDERAAMADQTRALDAVEDTIVRRAVPDDAPDADVLAKSEEMLRSMTRGTTAVLGPAKDWFGFLARSVDMQAQSEAANGPSRPPKPADEP